MLTVPSALSLKFLLSTTRVFPVNLIVPAEIVHDDESRANFERISPFFTTEAEISSSPTLSSVPVAYLLKSRAKLLIVVPSFMSEIVLFLPVASLMIGSSALKLPAPAYRYANR